MITKTEIESKTLTVVEFMLEMAALPKDNVKLSDNFGELGLDSLDVVEVVMGVEEHFKINIPDKEAQELVTVQDLVNLTEKILNNNT